jgi:hypothetical protein
MNDEKVIASLKHVSVKAARGSLQKITTWIEKSSKGKHEWEMACVKRGL